MHARQRAPVWPAPFGMSTQMAVRPQASHLRSSEESRLPGRGWFELMAPLYQSANVPRRTF
jgi:hypothetical protein